MNNNNKHTKIRKLKNVSQIEDNPISTPTILSKLLQLNNPRKETRIGSFLLNSKESDTIRKIAAINLGKIDSPKAKEILIKSTKTVKGDILATIVIAMSKYGDNKSLNAISLVKKKNKGFVRSQAAFALAIISHRLGLKGNELPPPNNKGYLKLFRESRPVMIKKAIKEELDICLKTIDKKPYGIELSQRFVYYINHGEYSIILLNRDLDSFESVKRLLKQKAIVGIIAQKSVELGSYFVSYLILTSPTKKGGEINIWLVRSYGKTCYGGTAKIKDVEVVFSVKSIAETGVSPFIIAGKIGRSGLILEKSRFSPITPIKKQPTRLN
jgi:hypothetical protein